MFLGIGWTVASCFGSIALGPLGIITFFVFKVLAWRVWLGQLRPRAYSIAALTLNGFAAPLFVWERLMMPTIGMNFILACLGTLDVLEGFVAALLATRRDRGAIRVVAVLASAAGGTYAVVLWTVLEIPGGYGP